MSEKYTEKERTVAENGTQSILTDPLLPCQKATGNKTKYLQPPLGEYVKIFISRTIEEVMKYSGWISPTD